MHAKRLRRAQVGGPVDLLVEIGARGLPQDEDETVVVLVEHLGAEHRALAGAHAPVAVGGDTHEGDSVRVGRHQVTGSS